jgi:hypothetical protein
MKTSTIIISAVLLAATFLPLIYLVTQTSRKENKIRKAIQKLCELNKITLSELEINGDLILGIDQTQKKLVCTSRKQLSEKFEIIDLNLQSDCKIKTLRTHGKHLEWVGLELANNTSKKEIVFYHEDEDDAPIVDPHKCLKEAEKWQNMIKPLLKAS